MAGTVELDIAGLEGNWMAQPRVFAHDAVELEVVDFGDLLVPVPATLPSGLEETVFMQRGACLYVGVDVEELKVEMESGNQVTFKNINSGSFLTALLAVKVIHAYVSTGPNVNVADGDIIAYW